MSHKCTDPTCPKCFANQNVSAEGRKLDAGKPRWSLLPWEALALVVDVLEHGAKKYSPGNWRKVPHPQERYFDACVRHLTAWNRGEKFDPESKLPHLAHACCCVLFLLDLDRAR